MHSVVIKQHRYCTVAHPHAVCHLPLCTQPKLKTGQDLSEDAELLLLEMETTAVLHAAWLLIFFFSSL